jgi:hypothetical protein
MLSGTVGSPVLLPLRLTRVAISDQVSSACVTRWEAIRPAGRLETENRIGAAAGVFLNRSRARGLGEAARLGELPGDLIGDQAAERVGVPGGRVGVDPAFYLDAQCPAGPASAGMGVDDAGYCPRDSQADVRSAGLETSSNLNSAGIERAL